MTLTLPPELQNFVQEEVKRGAYPSEEDVIRWAVLMLFEHERFMQLNHRRIQREVAIGLEQSRRGLSKPLDIEEIKREGRRRLRARRKAG